MTDKWHFLAPLGYRESKGWTLSAPYEALPAVTPLPHLGAWGLSGSGARGFLQGYVTSELTEAQTRTWHPTAFCNIKGRVLATAMISAVPSEVTLVMLEQSIDPVLHSLKKYLAFARGCRLVREERNIFGCVGAPEVNEVFDAVSFAGEQPLALALSSQDQAEDTWKQLCALGTPADARLWHWHELHAGFVHVSAHISEAFLPQMLGLEALGGVSYTKGCYLGQEIVTRAAHRGKVKRRLVRLEWEAEGRTEVEIGTKLVGERGREVGVLLASAPSPDNPVSSCGLAVVSGEPKGELNLSGHSARLRIYSQTAG